MDRLDQAITKLEGEIAGHATATNCADGGDCYQMEAMRKALAHMEAARKLLDHPALHRTFQRR